MLQVPTWRSRPWHTARLVSAPTVKVTCISQSAQRKRRSRMRQQKLAAGFERVELYLPPVVRAAWIARERISDTKAPLAVEHYPDDLAAVLEEWGERWLRAASQRDRSR
jgi:hypothetical protein